ncbi:DUF771 domain-containing protein [Cohnella xylanilytica]|uniref:DUF771 domain-containing protein n=1 Tax=Cohnella xylanilytica TaxID=557555 RepID=A0A841TXI7_9BACL|nr:DUF771 domain-containing protein [Cohnella xylanilytica]MBB6692319.1 DUF771 domain-containing protein [Cohnella xylanilytica]
MQRIKAEVVIQIPEEYVLISRVELEQLKSNELSGVYWSMKDLERRISRKSEWIKENILYPPRFRKILDVAHGGFVYYPRSKGQSWSFHAQKMADFLNNRFYDIWTGGINYETSSTNAN